MANADAPAQAVRLSVVTPTLLRPAEVRELLENLSGQTLLPLEVILVDGAPVEERETERVVDEVKGSLPFAVRYIRSGGGTAIQRNTGIEQAQGDFIALLDDDIRLDADFCRRIIEVFQDDAVKQIGAIVGYRKNEHFGLDKAERWRWYQRLKLFTTYEPGHYDFASGYPINANLQTPFRGVRRVDFMTTSCAVWRREVFDSGFRFDSFFRDYGMLEDAHFSLRAGRHWQLLQCGDARCLHMASPNGRSNRRKIGYKCVVNYYYVFSDIVGPLTWRHQVRFWRFQTFELIRIACSALRRRRAEDLHEVWGRIEGFVSVARGLVSH